MAQLKVNGTGFEVEADLGVVGELAAKRLPQKINEWWTNRKNKKLIKQTINNIHNLAFKPWKKYWQKFHRYANFSSPKSMSTQR